MSSPRYGQWIDSRHASCVRKNGRTATWQGSTILVCPLCVYIPYISLTLSLILPVLLLYVYVCVTLSTAIAPYLIQMAYVTPWWYHVICCSQKHALYQIKMKFWPPSFWNSLLIIKSYCKLVERERHKLCIYRYSLRFSSWSFRNYKPSLDKKSLLINRTKVHW